MSMKLQKNLWSERIYVVLIVQGGQLLRVALVAKEAAILGRMILGQGGCHSRGMTFPTIFFRLLFAFHAEKTTVIFIDGQ